jgi:hypothetical protein
LRDTWAGRRRAETWNGLQAIPHPFEHSGHLSENRGVAGSSPGLAIEERPRMRVVFRGREVGARRFDVGLNFAAIPFLPPFP